MSQLCATKGETDAFLNQSYHFSDDVENLKQEMQKLKTAVAKPPVVKFKKANFMDWFPFSVKCGASSRRSFGLNFECETTTI